MRGAASQAVARAMPPCDQRPCPTRRSCRPRARPARFGSASGVGLTSVFTFVIAFTYVGFGATRPRLRLLGRLGDAVDRAAMGRVRRRSCCSPGLGPGTSLIEIAVAVCAVQRQAAADRGGAVADGEALQRARPWQLLLPAHFMAVSVWVETMRHGPPACRASIASRSATAAATLLAVGVRLHRGGLLPAGAAAGGVRRGGDVHHADLVPNLERAQRQAAAGEGCARNRPHRRTGAGLQRRRVRSAVDRHHRRHVGLRAAPAPPRKLERAGMSIGMEPFWC